MNAPNDRRTTRQPSRRHASDEVGVVEPCLHHIDIDRAQERSQPHDEAGVRTTGATFEGMHCDAPSPEPCTDDTERRETHDNVVEGGGTEASKQLLERE